MQTTTTQAQARAQYEQMDAIATNAVIRLGNRKPGKVAIKAVREAVRLAVIAGDEHSAAAWRAAAFKLNIKVCW